MITQCTAALPGAWESHAKVRWANLMRQPAAKIGANRRAGWSPWTMEFVVTNAHSPSRSASRRRVSACQEVTKSRRESCLPSPQAACISASWAAVRVWSPRNGGLPNTNVRPAGAGRA